MKRPPEGSRALERKHASPTSRWLLLGLVWLFAFSHCSKLGRNSQGGGINGLWGSGEGYQGGDPLYEALRNARQTLVQSLGALKSSDIPSLCESFGTRNGEDQAVAATLRSLSDAQRQSCRDFLLAIKDEIISLNSGSNPVPFEVTTTPLVVEDPQGNPMPVAAMTTFDSEGPIYFNADAIRPLSPWELLAILVHESGHKALWNQSFATDNKAYPPFATGREMLDAVGAAVADMAFGQASAQMVELTPGTTYYQLDDTYTCGNGSNAIPSYRSAIQVGTDGTIVLRGDLCSNSAKVISPGELTLFSYNYPLLAYDGHLYESFASTPAVGQDHATVWCESLAAGGSLGEFDFVIRAHQTSQSSGSGSGYPAVGGSTGATYARSLSFYDRNQSLVSGSPIFTGNVSSFSPAYIGSGTYSTVLGTYSGSGLLANPPANLPPNYQVGFQALVMSYSGGTLNRQSTTLMINSTGVPAQLQVSEFQCWTGAPATAGTGNPIH